MKINLKGIVWKGVELIYLAWDRDTLRAFVKTVIEFWVPQNGGNILRVQVKGVLQGGYISLWNRFYEIESNSKV